MNTMVEFVKSMLVNALRPVTAASFVLKVILVVISIPVLPTLLTVFVMLYLIYGLIMLPLKPLFSWIRNRKAF